MKKTFFLFLICLIIFATIVCAVAESNSGYLVQDVDLDLSMLSGTVVYAQVYNLMVDYEPWLGKILKIAGYYSAFDDTEHGVVYHACIIPDATACCAQGIEFVWAGEHAWPEDYPKEEEDIIVTGRLETYEEDGFTYLHLADAELVREAVP